MAKAAANSGARVETEPSISQAGLDDLEHEQPLPGRRLVVQRAGGPLRALQLIGPQGVLALLTGQVIEQLADARVGGLPCGGLVEPLGLQLHQLDLLADGGQPQGAHQPDRLALDEALDILAAEQRNVLAELLAIEFDQSVPVPLLLGEHRLEDRRGGRVVRPEPLGEVTVNAGVLFFEGDGQGQDLPLTEALKRAHRVQAPGRLQRVKAGSWA